MLHHHNRPYIDAVETTRRTDLEPLVHAAALGDDSAWAELVARFTRHLTRLVRSQRVPAHDVEDVVQATFMRLHEHLGTLRDPHALPGWLETTARREALRSIRAMLRERPLDIDVIADLPAPGAPDPRGGEELRAELLRALEQLPERQRALLLALSHQDEPSYEEISSRLGMPIGSIGPTRGRALERLRGNLMLRAAAVAAAEDRCLADGAHSHVPYWAGATN